MLDLSKILVVDIESTCWEKGKEDGNISETIEIGSCLLSLVDQTITQKHSTLIKPTISEVSDFCTKLTTITRDNLDLMGKTFEEACSYLSKIQSAERSPWASWGEYDKIMIKRQCDRMGVKYPFTELHINVKLLFSVKHRLNKLVGMRRALGMCKLELEGTHHRGADDANNIARLLRTCV